MSTAAAPSPAAMYSAVTRATVAINRRLHDGVREVRLEGVPPSVLDVVLAGFRDNGWIVERKRTRWLRRPYLAFREP